MKVFLVSSFPRDSGSGFVTKVILSRFCLTFSVKGVVIIVLVVALNFSVFVYSTTVYILLLKGLHKNIVKDLFCDLIYTMPYVSFV